MTLRTTAIRAARIALGLLPDSLVGRILPRSLRWGGGPLSTARPPTSAVRLLVGPVNSAGQGYRWARAAEVLADVGAVNLTSANAATARFNFPSDVSVPETAYLFAAGWQRRQRNAVESGFTHVLLESGRYLYGTDPARTPLEVANRTAAHGVAIALVWHGSDIRLPSAHAEWERDSPFGKTGSYPVDSTRRLEANARGNRQMIEQSDFPVFVSTPGLLDVPRSRWLPVVVDPGLWRCDRPALTGDIPVVAYVPSNTALKGDAQIDEQLMALDAAGIIVYRRLEGVPADRMPDVYGDADIVLDQFRLGDYGVAACEAMAAGRLVVGHVHDDVRAAVHRETGLELPIVEARFDEVGERVRQVVENPREWAAAAASGAAFVEAVHDGGLSAKVLAAFLSPASRGSSEAR